jgi:hypothetical protein
MSEYTLQEIKKELGDCDFMRGCVNEYTVQAILWLIKYAEELENKLDANICSCENDRVLTSYWTLCCADCQKALAKEDF